MGGSSEWYRNDKEKNTEGAVMGKEEKKETERKKGTFGLAKREGSKIGKTPPRRRGGSKELPVQSMNRVGGSYGKQIGGRKNH